MAGRAVDGGYGDPRFLAALGLAWVAQSGSHSALKLLCRASPEEVWAAGSGALVEWGMEPAAAARFVKARRSFSLKQAAEVLDRSGLRFIHHGHPLYPEALTNLCHPPAGLFAQASEAGLTALQTAPRITIVGTRKATAYGLRVADMFSEAFACAGVAVISGLALGIDGRAHRAALGAGGQTFAVLGCGADVVYPRRHRSLHEAVARTGAVVSELPPGHPPSRWTFPQRNRLLAALGDAVLVVEGSLSSGAMHTAGEAASLGRPVYTVPGPVGVDNHRGCNMLLYDGAFPAVDPGLAVEDFFAQTRIERGGRCRLLLGAGPAGGAEGSGQLPGLVAAGREGILRAVSERACSADSLVARTGMPARTVAGALAELELAGYVVRAGPGLFIRAP
jgi:DNA processing protein